jgi:hypothetical protein
MHHKEEQIIGDISRVGRSVGRISGKDKLSRAEYFGNGAKFGMYDIYDGGKSWEYYAEKAGYRSKAVKKIPDEVYFENLKTAVATLGRIPKATERKAFGLNFSKRRWATLNHFIEDAIERGIIVGVKKQPIKESVAEEAPQISLVIEPSDAGRAVPPIPIKSKRKSWERTGIVGFPYAPHDESGTVALFAVLCSKGIIPWQILTLNSSKGIDSICYDDRSQKEIRVELKYILSKAAWNHSFDSFDYLVCWERRWKDFPKPVLELKELLS